LLVTTWPESRDAAGGLRWVVVHGARRPEVHNDLLGSLSERGGAGAGGIGDGDIGVDVRGVSQAECSGVILEELVVHPDTSAKNVLVVAGERGKKVAACSPFDGVVGGDELGAGGEALAVG